MDDVRFDGKVFVYNEQKDYWEWTIDGGAGCGVWNSHFPPSPEQFRHAEKNSKLSSTED